MSPLRRVQIPLRILMPVFSKHNNLFSTKNSNSKDIIKINVKGEHLKFPSVWLRDNCQCSECFHVSAQSRIIDWSKFNVDVLPDEVKEEVDSITIKWNDGHSSHYNFDWLKKRSFASLDRKKHDNFYKPPKVTWNGEEFSKILKRHEYDKVINSEKHLHDWLQDLSVYGVALIENVPSKDDAVDAVINKVGFIKKTHYGEKFIVENRQDTSNVAYLSSNLQVHTDLPYYEYCPGVNVLHCLTQTSSKGGNNVLSDSHYVAHYMRINHPDEYCRLTSVEVEWSDIGVEFGNEFHKLFRGPVVCEDECGHISRINFSIPQRGNHFPTDIENVKPWYVAHGLFLELSHRFAASFKTEAGEMLCFDNIRLLHGRTEYADTSGNVRKLVGAYLDWDEIYSRLRCLKTKLNADI